MFRRNFLKWLGITPAVAGNFREGIYKGGQNEPPKTPRPDPPKGQGGNDNPKNLPIAKFDENGCVENYKELLGDKDEVLVFVRKEDALTNCFTVFWGEVLLKYTFYGESKVEIFKCKDTEVFLQFDSTKNSKIIKSPNQSHCWVGNWRKNNVS